MPRRAAHFHALYAEDEVRIDIRTELMEDWELCAHNQPPKKIRPLP